ncbi:class I SAM-dependent methyltransferase [Chloroflexota bacterium]
MCNHFSEICIFHWSSERLITDQHFNIERAPVLENQGRLAELRIDKLFSVSVEVKEGMTCIDLGSGTGVFSFALANYVGENGVVYAVDDSNEMLEYIRKKNPPQNVLLIHRDAGDTGLESEMADVCLLAFILHEVNTPDRLINEAYRLLKPKGKVLIVEWKVELTPKGPPVDVRITKAKLRQLFNQSGFVDFTYIDWSINHYVAVGTR